MSNCLNFIYFIIFIAFFTSTKKHLIPLYQASLIIPITEKIIHFSEIFILISAPGLLVHHKLLTCKTVIP